jgi:hypothetical protein
MIAHTVDLPPADMERVPYLKHGQKRFEFVLVLNKGHIPHPAAIAAQATTSARQHEMAALYRVVAPNSFG